MNIVTEVSKVTKQVKYLRITILGFIINTIYEIPTNAMQSLRRTSVVILRSSVMLKRGVRPNMTKYEVHPFLY